MTDDQTLALAQRLFVIKEHWPEIVNALQDEAQAAAYNGLFDASRPREYYAGYVVGLEFLAKLPEWVEERAEAIKRQRDETALEEAPEVAKTLRSKESF